MRIIFKSLLLHYLIWNSMAIGKLLRSALPLLAFLFVDQRTFSELDLSPSALAYSFWDTSKGPLPWPSGTGEMYPIDTPLWFVRDLMIVVLATPLINLVITKINIYAVIILGSAWISTACSLLEHHSKLQTTFSFSSWGVYLSIITTTIFIDMYK